ncbi:hypothetical protein [Haliea sp. E17]|uniref:hypothetical protein n=1 Tax=Haliea sp. E17 TaxID=3401576 RepID=UPI003AAF8633
MSFFIGNRGARAVLAVGTLTSFLGLMPVQAENPDSSTFGHPAESDRSVGSSVSVASGFDSGTIGSDGQRIYSDSNPTSGQLLIANVELQTNDLDVADPVSGVVGGGGSDSAVQARKDDTTLNVIWLALSVLLGFGVVARRRPSMSAGSGNE